MTDFAARHIGPSQAAQQHMLASLGYSSLGELTEAALPAGTLSTYTGAAELSPPGGLFVVGYLDSELVCCGGVKRLDDRTFVQDEAGAFGVIRPGNFRRLRADVTLGEVPIIIVTALDDLASRLAGLEAHCRAAVPAGSQLAAGEPSRLVLPPDRRPHDRHLLCPPAVR